MPRFSETIMDHFQEPRHRGSLGEATHVGTVGVPGQGPYFVLQLQVLGDVIQQATYQCNACGITIACGSLLCEQLPGRTLSECRQLTTDHLLTWADGLPVDKQHCATTAMSALNIALTSYP